MKSKVRGNPDVERRLGLEGAAFGSSKWAAWKGDVSAWGSDDSDAAPPVSPLDTSFPDVVRAAGELGDPWLEQLLADVLVRPTLWHRVAALGLFIRLRREPPLRRPSEALSAALHVDESHVVELQAFRWARSLRLHEIIDLDDGLRAACDRLDTALRDVFGGTRADDDEWRSALGDLCRSRDEVEAVFQVLDRRGPLLVWQRLMVLDQSAAPLVAILGREVRIDDEHLRRVGDGDPWSWWAVLAQEP